MSSKMYFEVQVNTAPGLDHNIIIARLAALGFDGFIEEEDHVLAYKVKEKEEAADISDALRISGLEAAGLNLMEDQNWNEAWESDYQPVVIGNDMVVRAPFHKPMQGIEYDIVIEPRMAFGTAHHETTEQMLMMIHKMDIRGKKVLDMGCGTAVLAILAGMMGAAEVLAIDNDEWAYHNSIDNIRLNKGIEAEVLHGDAGLLENREFDIIFANINRNILLEDIPQYAGALAGKGKLLLSGFYLEDLPVIEEKSAASGLRLLNTSVKNNWVAALFIRN
ncbi:MAG: 50S ribosomal protein L11 methyltransferase [Bacteroidales bacterium]|jgi:ribosomal protein L11 methyltransferase|nr:50S ribosomal protein L11 methyltransferase [Bacteroidales bacterium]